MIQVLEQLSNEVGIRGAMLVARDGFPIASGPIRGVDRDTVGAIASSLLKAITECLEGQGRSTKFSRFVMTTAHGRLVFVDSGSEAYIIAITDKSLNIDEALLAMNGAAQRIKRMSEMSDVQDDAG